MWKILITDEASVTLVNGELTEDDLQTIKTWVRTVSKFGPEGLLKYPDKWADHPLFGEWKGFRSSSFSYKGRIIYEVKERIITVIVVRITANHSYRTEKV